MDSAWTGWGIAAAMWRGIFFLLLVLCVLCLLWSAIRNRGGGKGSGGAARFVFVILTLLLLGMYAYQGTWQLAGFLRPEFIAFMQRYSRRSVNPAREQERGRILDRNGVILAADTPAGFAGGGKGGRRYPLGPDFAHLVGYNAGNASCTGLESADNRALTGGSMDLVKDFRQFGRGMLRHDEVRGQDLKLTLDARLQHAARKLLQDRPGAVVGLRPSDGAILVLASSPSFDPNDLMKSLGLQARSPMFNRALHGQYPPGSVFKIILAAAAIETGLGGARECRSGYVALAGTSPIRDHEYYEQKRKGQEWSGFGSLTLAQAFSRSSNVYFAQLGTDLGADRMASVMGRFHLKEPLVLFTGSSHALASAGCRIPDLADADRRLLAELAIGQGPLTVTPLHMAMMTAAVASGGWLFEPHCAAGAAPKILGRVLNRQVAEQIKRMMELSVLEGTSSGMAIPGLRVAGKTGTAQASNGADHSWFVCFAPAERPRLVLAVVVEHGGYGSASALPIARELMVQAEALGLLAPAGGSRQAGK